MDASRIVRRIYDNLNWSAPFELPGLCPPEEVWRRLHALWRKPDRTFVVRLYPLLLGRPADAESLAALRAVVARGTPRSVVVRQLALSDEARAKHPDVSWLPRLASLEAEAVWPRLHVLWRAPDRVFVKGLYRLLLGRAADAAGVAGFCALLATGAPRSEAVRRVALSDEARAAGLDVSWLSRLDHLEHGRRRLSFRSLKTLVLRLLGGRKVVLPSPAAPDEVRRAA